MKFRILAVSALVGGALLATPLAAQAASTPSGLTSEQSAAVALLNSSATVSGATSAPTATWLAAAETAPSSTYSTAAVRSQRLKLYRGSALMWARDTMNYYYNGKKVTSASLAQEAGFIAPNISRAKGATRYYNASAQQAWRGKYTIGAGVPSPWGDVTVYSADYSTDWHVYGNGAGNGKWN